MTTPTIHSSASGSLMLMGEHAVLHGHPALCAAVSHRIEVSISEGDKGTFEIHSGLGTVSGDLNQVTPEPPLEFVMEAIREVGIFKGFRMDIESGISSTIGYGTSAAVCVAAVAALRAWKGETFDRAKIFETALKIVRNIQGRASGADVAAAVYGGVVRYVMDPVQLEPIRCSLPLATVYCGYKTPTADVIDIVERKREQNPELFDRLYLCMGDCVNQAVKAIRSGDIERLGSLFQVHQGLQKAIGTEDKTLSELLYALESQPTVSAAKISGSGLGDCVIALGDSNVSLPGYESAPVHIDCEGVSLTHSKDV